VLLLDVRHGRVLERREAMLPGTNPLEQARRMAALAPSVLICGAISHPMARLLEAHHIEVVPFTAGAVEDVLQAWLGGKLPSPDLCMPGCCARRCRRRRGRFGK
jgi:predicted Fe-Mo cluster-binding NifX family protein